jgi:hypothetical protein
MVRPIEIYLFTPVDAAGAGVVALLAHATLALPNGNLIAVL